MKTYTEVTISDGYSEFMVHLVEGEPVRLYTYRDTCYESAPDKGRTVRHESAEETCYEPRNYKPSSNPLFVDCRSLSLVRFIWNGYLEGFYDPETE